MTQMCLVYTCTEQLYIPSGCQKHRRKDFQGRKVLRRPVVFKVSNSVRLNKFIPRSPYSFYST